MEDGITDIDQFWEGWDGDVDPPQQLRGVNEMVQDTRKAFSNEPYDPQNNFDSAEDMWAGVESDGEDISSPRVIASRMKGEYETNVMLHAVTCEFEDQMESLQISKPSASGLLQIATISLDRSHRDNADVGTVLSFVSDLIPRCAQDGAELVVLPESFLAPVSVLCKILRDQGAKRIQELHQLALECLSTLAKRYDIYIIFGSLFKDLCGILRNGAHVLNKQGEKILTYSKRHPGKEELESGIIPGDGGDILFEAEWGSVGIALGYDCNFPQDWATFQSGSKQQVSLVCFLSEKPCNRRMQGIAMQNHTWIVTSCRQGASSIVDVSGSVVNQSTLYHSFVHSQVNLSRTVVLLDELQLSESVLQQLDLYVEPVQGEDELVWVEASDGDIQKVRSWLSRNATLPYLEHVNKLSRLQESALRSSKEFL